MVAEIIRRRFRDEQTTGDFILYSDSGKVLFNAYTLELDMDGNKENESCIPYGIYDLIPLIDRPEGVKYSKENYGYFPYLIKDVPNRSGILMHHANFNEDLLGCVGLGDDLVDIDANGYKDVTNSVATLKELNKVLKEPVELAVKAYQMEQKSVDPAYLTNY